MSGGSIALVLTGPEMARLVDVTIARQQAGEAGATIHTVAAEYVRAGLDHEAPVGDPTAI